MLFNVDCFPFQAVRVRGAAFGMLRRTHLRRVRIPWGFVTAATRRLG